MKRIVVLLCLALMAGLWSSCNSIADYEAQSYDRSKVAEVIASHDTTILYFMTSWCMAGQRDFENNMKPYLGKASDTKAIVVVCVGELGEVMRLEGCYDNVFLFNKASRQSLFDRGFINNECKNF